MSANLYDLIRTSAPQLDKIAIDCTEGPSLSYGELFDRAGQAANALLALGVRPGDRVAAQVDKSSDMIVLALACYRAGAVLLPLNTAYTLAELEYFLADAKPALVVCRPSLLHEVRALADNLALSAVESLGLARNGTLAAKMAQARPHFDPVPRTGADLAAILYTSGTTGRPKGAMLTHHNLSSNALALVDYWRFTREDVLIHALPVFHAHGLFVATNVVLLAGSTMIFQPRFDADAVVDALPRATCLMGVPTFYTRLLAHSRLTQDKTRHMRLFVSGSAPLLAETHAAWRSRTGHAILERYGMTETNMITSNPYDGDRVAGTVGLPLPGISLRIAEPETGRILNEGETGVIEIKGPNVFNGYWRMPEKTAEEFRPDGFFITGDLGKIDDRGYVHIVGRGKDLIISGGFNVYPKEVEIEIDALPGVHESAVIGLPHPDFGEAVTAMVVPKKEEAPTEEGLLKELGGRLAKFKLPKRVFFVEELPRNAMGKVQKNVLREERKGTYEAKGRSPDRTAPDNIGPASSGG